MDRIGRRKPQFGLLTADYFLWMCCIPAHMKRYFADRQDISNFVNNKKCLHVAIPPHGSCAI